MGKTLGPFFFFSFLFFVYFCALILIYEVMLWVYVRKVKLERSSPYSFRPSQAWPKGAKTRSEKEREKRRDWSFFFANFSKVIGAFLIRSPVTGSLVHISCGWCRFSLSSRPGRGTRRVKSCESSGRSSWMTVQGGWREAMMEQDLLLLTSDFYHVYTSSKKLCTIITTTTVLIAI